jgi:hypothetical protein
VTIPSPTPPKPLTEIVIAKTLEKQLMSASGQTLPQ